MLTKQNRKYLVLIIVFFLYENTIEWQFDIIKSFFHKRIISTDPEAIKYLLEDILHDISVLRISNYANFIFIVCLILIIMKKNSN